MKFGNFARNFKQRYAIFQGLVNTEVLRGGPEQKGSE